VQWTRVDDTGPAPRRLYGMAYDSIHVLLYGGTGMGAFGDTWAWDGKHWTQLQDIGPGPRSSLGMTFDSARQRVVLFGGLNTSSSPLADTWETFEQAAQN